MPKTEVGPFTAEYLAVQRTTDGPNYDYKHGFRADSREELLEKAREVCPAGMYLKSIAWQCAGTQTTWYKVVDRPDAKCWDERVCKLAFGG